MQTYKAFEKMERGNTRKRSISRSGDKGLCNGKAIEARQFIKECLEASRNPVCLVSFGKDSLVMLHMILQIKKVPIIYWREPFYQSKFRHANEISEKWDLTVYDYPPTYTDFLCLDDYFDVYNYYDIGGTYMNLYTGTRNYTTEDKKYLCAVNDLLNRPKVPAYEFNWDCIFHGHKQSDPLYITDYIELPKVKMKPNGFMALPIKEWSDDEIWEYINYYDLPYNKARYDSKDEKRNNDLFPTCHDCLDPKNKNGCYCKKYKEFVPFVGKTKEQNEKDRECLVKSAY